MRQLDRQAQSSRFRVRFPNEALALLLLFVLLCCFQQAEAGPETTGKWSGKRNWQGTPVHLVLMPTDSAQVAIGDTADATSAILWWRGRAHHHELEALEGGLQFWSPRTDYAESLITRNFRERPVPYAGHDLFCGAHAQLSDGRIAIFGGTEVGGGETGTDEVKYFDPVTRNWSSAPSMRDRRWYPSAVSLGDSLRIAVVSGSSRVNLNLFGGRTGVSTLATDSLRRYANIGPGGSLQKVKGAGTWPSAREGHVAFKLPSPESAEFVIFGRDADSTLQSVWKMSREPNTDGADYAYVPTQVSVDINERPVSRYRFIATPETQGSEHRIMIHGGYRDFEGIKQALSDMTRLQRSNLNVWSWATVDQFDDADGFPSARCGHVALLDEARDRLLVFGGAETPTSAPTDTSVWAFVFDDDTRLSGTWSKPTVSGPGPLAVAGAAFAFDPSVQHDAVLGANVKRAFIFGGRSDSAGVITSYRNSMHVLTINNATGALSWSRPALTSAIPTPRADASLVHDASLQRMYVVGGVDSAGNRLSSVHRVVIGVGATTGTWQSLAALDVAVSGASGVLSQESDFSRVPEVLNSGAGTFTAHDGSPRLFEWYPFLQLLPRGGGDSVRVFVAGPDVQASLYRPDVPDSLKWRNIGGATDKGGSAVQYSTGKILKAGSRDTDLYGSAATGRSWIIDTQPGTPTWTQVGSLAKPRVNLNMTLLTDGKVLALGGTDSVDNAKPRNPIYAPEIWDPLTEEWSGADVLDTSMVIRDYHSNAILLPDGRVLHTSGNVPLDVGVDRHLTSVFTPPSMYESGGALRTRPQILGARALRSRGDSLWLVVGASVDQLVLMYPGSATHGYDAGQKRLVVDMVQTRFATGSDSTYLVRAKLPTDKGLMPPGHWMAFVVNDGMPSIARWIHVGEPRKSTRDMADRVRPRRVTDLAVTVDCGLEAELSWTAPADDSSWAETGGVTAYDVRYRTDTTNSWASFASATQAYDEPGPGDIGDTQTMTVGDLTGNTTYRFRMVSQDDRNSTGNTSGLSNLVSYTAHYCDEGMGSGEGGGGSSAERSTTQSRATRNTSEGLASRFTLLDGLASGASGQDVVRLPQAPEAVEGARRLTLDRGSQAATVIEHAALVAVDAADTLEVHALADGEYVSGTRAQATLSVVLEGADTVLDDGDSLTAALPEGAVAVLVTASAPYRAAAGAALGLDVQARDGEGWRTLSRLHPQAGGSTHALELDGAREVRVLANGVHRVSAVAALMAADEPTVQRSQVASVVHSEDGEVSLGTEGVRADGGESVTLSVPEPSAAANGQQRHWFLEVTGRHDDSRSVPTLLKRTEEAPAEGRLWLASNQPNPFAGRTLIRFSLPRAGEARLEVFDLAGRRVATPLRGRTEAGVHSVDWDGHGANGVRLAPGVYVYRLTFGSERIERRLVKY